MPHDAATPARRRPVSFAATPEERTTIARIVDRAMTTAPAGLELDRLSLMMDITATHANGTPLDLERLAGFPRADFWHDVGGIMGHIDRTTGRLTRHFLPRSARPQQPAQTAEEPTA